MQRLSPAAPSRDTEHDARVRSAVARATRDIPFYARRGYGPLDEGAPLDEALRGLPLLMKQDLRTALPREWVEEGRDVKGELAKGELELVETSGSTASRLRILWDKGWWLRQEERAMRVNGAVARALDGEKGAYREAVLTTPVCGMAACHAGDLTYEERVDEHRVFLNTRPDPTFWSPDAMTQMLDELSRHGTVGLESDPAYLAALAEHAFATHRAIDVTGFVQLTYAETTRAHLRSIRKAYAGPLYQLYGASEVGVLFMETEDGLLQHAPYTTHVELLRAKVPTPGAKDVALVVVTTLDRAAQPLVRFVVGDLVQIASGSPALFTSVPPLFSVEGRVQDALVRPDGALVTAGAIDRALDGLAMRAFQATQEAPDAVLIDVVPDGEAGSVVEQARDRLAGLCLGLTLSVRASAAIPAEASGKFRVSRRDFPLDLSRTFEACDGASS